MSERKQFVKTICLALGFTLFYAIATQAQTCYIPEEDLEHIYCDSKRFQVKGANYYPKDNAWDRFWQYYDDAKTESDLILAKSLGVNTIRIFIPYQPAYPFDWADVVKFMNLCSSPEKNLNLKVIVTLFDLVNSQNVPYAELEASKLHIDEVIANLGGDNAAIIAWDVKNELDRDYGKSDPAYGGTENVKSWAREMIKYIRERSMNLITVGFYGEDTDGNCDPDHTLYCDPADPDTTPDTKIYCTAIAKAFVQNPDPLENVDFVSMHYFLPELCFQNDLRQLQDDIGEMPIVLEEFGLHSMVAYDADPHDENDQASYFNALLSISESQDIAGYLFWTLNDFSYIMQYQTGSGEWVYPLEKTHHCQGVLRNQLCNECEKSTDTDDTVKPAGDIILSHYNDALRYTDEANGWVDGYPETPASIPHRPPPGWDDNRASGGVLRGFDPYNVFGSHARGKFAFSRYGADGLTDDIGKASSPLLNNIDLDTYPFLALRVHSYGHRVVDQGGCTLRVKVAEDGPVLWTFDGESSLPEPCEAPCEVLIQKTFSIDLRPYLGSGSHTFQIFLELVPKGGDGYSSAYELDWIRIQDYNTAFDLNADMTVDLVDGLLALQVLAGLNPSQLHPDTAGASDGNNAISLEHAVYPLQVVADLR